MGALRAFENLFFLRSGGPSVRFRCVIDADHVSVISLEGGGSRALWLRLPSPNGRCGVSERKTPHSRSGEGNASIEIRRGGSGPAHCAIDVDPDSAARDHVVELQHRNAFQGEHYPLQFHRN